MVKPTWDQGLFYKLKMIEIDMGKKARQSIIRKWSMILRVNVVLNIGLLLTVANLFSTTCQFALVIFRVKVSCIKSIHGIKLWVLILWVLVVCQLSRDIISYEDS